MHRAETRAQHYGTPEDKRRLPLIEGFVPSIVSKKRETGPIIFLFGAVLSQTLCSHPSPLAPTKPQDLYQYSPASPLAAQTSPIPPKVSLRPSHFPGQSGYPSTWNLFMSDILFPKTKFSPVFSHRYLSNSSFYQQVIRYNGWLVFALQ
jgi:hypothetical protein